MRKGEDYSLSFQLVHSDVVEMDVLSTGGNKYFVTFLDDHTRKLWFYPMAHKSEVFEKFKIFTAYAERQSGEQIQTLRSDNVGEYLNRPFKKYLQERGIKHQLTVPYNPEQHGRAERVNRSIMDKVRCMLTESGLPKPFWGEAANKAVYLLNRCPAKAINFKIPEELWRGYSVSVNHLRIFGSKVFAHIPKEKRRKLDNPGREGVFVSYAEDRKGYRVQFGDEVSR